MRQIIIWLLLLVTPFVALAQRMDIYIDKDFNADKYIALYAYGLQRDVVRTNSEMKAAQFNGDGTGIMKRHYTTLGSDEKIGDDGYSCNDKMSFAFVIAPYNVDKDGNHTHDPDTKLTWAIASGWAPSLDTQISNRDINNVGIGESIAATDPTGCAAYKGINGNDEPGDWRLPTQREIQVMFTVIEQALDYIQSGVVTHQIINGDYWTSTEFYNSGAAWSAWSMNSIIGKPNYDVKTNMRMARCVKDIYEPINQ